MSSNESGEVLLQDVRTRLVRASEPVTGRIVENDLCMNGKSASFVRHTVIDVAGTPLEGAFRAGQSFGVIPPGVDESGRPHKVRLYSLACPGWGEDGHGRVISTTTKRLVDEFSAEKSGKSRKTDEASRAHQLFLGVCSNYLCDLGPGDEVQVCGPNGKRFQLPRDPFRFDYLFLATGTGIAPFRGMLMELLDAPPGAEARPCGSRIHLLMGAPYRTDLLYHDFFEALADRHPNFHYHTAISREKRPDGRAGLYVHERLEEDLDTFRPLLASPRTLIYVCGLQGMQNGLIRMLARHGLAGGYFDLKKELAQTSPDDWPEAQIGRNARPTARCLLEVY